MDTRHLKIFTTVYKTRSFTKAAEELYTSQPTVSEHMRNLEDNLGCKLFDRLGRSILPTPEAELLYPKAEEILNEMSKLKKTLGKSNPLKFQRFKHQALVFDEQLLNQSANFALTKIPNMAVAIKLAKNNILPCKFFAFDKHTKTTS